MNQPTREEFERLEEEQRQLKEDVRILKQQQTEPIKITSLEIQIHGARADILQIRESQADLRDRLIEHSEDLRAIKDKQDAHSDILGQLVNIGEETKTTLAEHGDMLKLILAELRKPRGE